MIGFTISRSHQDSALDALLRIEHLQTGLFAKRLAMVALADLRESYATRMRPGVTLYQGIKDVLGLGTAEPGVFTGATIRGMKAQVNRAEDETSIELHLKGRWPGVTVPPVHVPLEAMAAALADRGIPLNRLQDVATPGRSSRRFVPKGEPVRLRRPQHPIPVYTEGATKYYRATASRNLREGTWFQPMEWEKSAGMQLVSEYSLEEGGEYAPMQPSQVAMMSIMGNVRMKPGFGAGEAKQAFGEKAEWGAQAQAFGALGATVSVTQAGLKIMWDKALKKTGKFHDVHIPAQDLENKAYGEFGRMKDFMYLTERQCDDLSTYVFQEMERILEGDFRGPAVEPRAEQETVAPGRTERERMLYRYVASQRTGAGVGPQKLPTETWSEEAEWVTFGDTLAKVPSRMLADTGQEVSPERILSEMGEEEVMTLPESGQAFEVPRGYKDYKKFLAWIHGMRGEGEEPALETADKAFETMLKRWEDYFKNAASNYQAGLEGRAQQMLMQAFRSHSDFENWLLFARTGGPEARALGTGKEFEGIDIPSGEKPGWLKDAFEMIEKNPRAWTDYTDEELLLMYIQNRRD